MFANISQQIQLDTYDFDIQVQVNKHLAELEEGGTLAKTWGQFKTAREKAGSDVKSTWDQSSQLAVRTGQDRQKRQQLLAWVCDPTWKNAYAHLSRSICRDNVKQEKE